VFLLENGVSTPNNTEEFSDIEASEGISDYEKMRLKNIRERELMFHQLHLDELKTRLSDSFAQKVSLFLFVKYCTGTGTITCTGILINFINFFFIAV
jgi:hypothetical protein